jgi:hypothetical protein
MKRDPLRGLSPLAKAFVLCVVVVLTLVFGFAVYAAFFVGAGPISKMLGALFFIGFCVAMAWLQFSWWPRKLNDLIAWGRSGPPTGPSQKTLAALDEARRKKRQASRSHDEGP